MANFSVFGRIIRAAPDADDVVGAIGLLAARLKLEEGGVQLWIYYTLAGSCAGFADDVGCADLLEVVACGIGELDENEVGHWSHCGLF